MKQTNQTRGHGTCACDLATANLEAAVAPVLEKYLGYLTYLRPGQSRDIYPWHNPEDVVMEAARRLQAQGYQVVRMRYTGCRSNYSGGDYYLRVTAPGATVRPGFVCRIIAGLQNRLCQAGC
ncbi:MAG: hypothetical protein K8F91_10045 [Candidatus Obscuribacterales bacterium]|nr:hypothetical protein [Candidatus Obscuribacterales bacterium]